MNLKKNFKMRWILDLSIIIAFSFLFIFFNFGCSTIPIQRSDASGYGPNTNVNNKLINSPKLSSNLSSDNLIESSMNIENYSGPLDYKLMTKLGMTPEALKDSDLFKKYLLLQNITQKEKNLNDDREKKQYYSAQPWFENDDERLEFLNQPGYEARVLWMRKNKFGTRSNNLDNNIVEVIEKKDIFLGMSQDWVKKSWGQPELVDVAGNPIYKNERWRYKKYVPSSEGFKLQKRLVYFEGGKVVGWEQIDE